MVTGRDVDDQQLHLRFENLTWHLVERSGSEEIFREQIPPVLFRLVAFLKDCREWTGTATELLAALDDRETPGNIVTKYLARYADEVLRPAGIRYLSRRTGQSRLLHFTHDSCDSHDGNPDI